MESLESCVKILDESLAQKKFPIPETKLADLIYDIYRALPKADKPAVQALQPNIESFLLNILQKGGTRPLRRYIIRTLARTLEYGNINRVADLILEGVKLANNTKQSNKTRIAGMELAGKIFYQFAQKIPTPCTEDIFELNKRLYKSIVESNLREAAADTLLHVILAKPSNLRLFVNDILKFLIKILTVRNRQDRSTKVRKSVAKSISSILEGYPNLLEPHYESLLNLSIRGLEEAEVYEYTKLLSKIWTVNLERNLNIGQVSLNRRVEGMPKNLLDVIFTISGLFSRCKVYTVNITYEVRVGLVLTLSQVLDTCKEFIQGMTEINLVLDALLAILTRASQNEIGNWKAQELISWLVVNFISKDFTAIQLKFTLDYLLNKISTLRPYIHESSTLESEPLTARRNPTPVVELQVIVCLRACCPIFYKIPSALLTYGENLFKPILSLLSSPNLSKYATKTLQAFGLNQPKFMNQILSHLLTYTSIAHAELEGLKATLTSKEQAFDPMNALIGQCLTFSSLLRAINFTSTGVPMELPLVAINTAKALIVGKYHVEGVEEENIDQMEDLAIELDTARRMGGWMILEALMYLGPNWVGSHLTLLFGLLKLPFGRNACIFENPRPVVLISELQHKKAAGGCLLSFLENNGSLLNPQIYKVLALYLTNALQFLCPQSNSTIRRQFFHANSNPADLYFLKYLLYKSISYIPITYLNSKFVLILQPICAELVSDKIKRIPTIYQKWLNCDDDYLMIKTQHHELYALTQTSYNEHLSDNWLRQEISSTYIYSHQGSNLQGEMLTHALIVLAEIFSSSSLNLNNRDQLLKHFRVHLKECLKNKDTNPLKNIKTATLLLTTLGCLKRLDEHGMMLTDQDLIDKIRWMFSSVEGSANILIKRIYSEGLIYLCKVISDTQFIPVFMKEIEYRVTLPENDHNVKANIVLLISNMYKHFDHSYIEKNAQALGHIIQQVSRDSEVGAWAIHALYKVYHYYGNSVENIVQATFPLAFHHYLEDAPGYFDYSRTMLKLSALHIKNSGRSEDTCYHRALFILEDLWKHKSEGLEVLAELLVYNLIDNVKEVLEEAFNKLPEKIACEFIEVAISLGLGQVLIDIKEDCVYKLFVVYDQTGQPELKDILRELITIEAAQRLNYILKLFKYIVQTLEHRKEKLSTGMSAQDERHELDTTRQHNFCHVFNLKSKIYAIESLIYLIRNLPKPKQTPTKTYSIFSDLESLVSFSFALTSGEEIQLQIYGIKLLYCIFECFSFVKDPEDKNHLYIELFEAQFSAAIRSLLLSDTPDVAIEVCSLLYKFLEVPGTQDISVVSKILSPLLNLLGSSPKGKDHAVFLYEEYSEKCSCTVHFTRLLTICRILVNSEGFIKEYIRDHCGDLKITLLYVIEDMFVLLTQSRNTVKDHVFKLSYPIIDGTSNDLGYIQYFIYALMVLSPSTDETNFLLSVAVAFLFLPFPSSRENPLLTSSEEIHAFVQRRKMLLLAISKMAPNIQDDKLQSELINSLNLCISDPSIDNKRIILQIYHNLAISEIKSIRKIEEIILGILINYTELEKEAMECWSWCVSRYKDSVNSDICEEYLDIDSLRSSVIDFFDEALARSHMSLVKSTLGSFKSIEETEFYRYVMNRILSKLVSGSNGEMYKFALEILCEMNCDELGYYLHILEAVKEKICDMDKVCPCILQYLASQVPNRPPIINVLISSIVMIFTYKKQSGELNENEAMILSEALKLLLTVFKYSSNKEMILGNIVTILLSMYLYQTPVPLIKGVTRAINQLLTVCPHQFRQIVMNLPEHEKKYLENMIRNELSSGNSLQVEQPTIKLQIKLKK